MSENNGIDFDALENEVKQTIKVNQKKAEEEAKEIEENSKFTSGWKKGPFIVAGVIAAILLIASAYIMFIM